MPLKKGKSNKKKYYFSTTLACELDKMRDVIDEYRNIIQTQNIQISILKTKVENYHKNVEMFVRDIFGSFIIEHSEILKKGDKNAAQAR